ncbi:hypothetical protein EDB19DRAFT_2040357 [Suillus lakei]|nr:hypothetical protein EDB19DRAFT_2040357 [Suillus lakei]
MFIFLVVIFLAINIACGVMLATGFEYIVGEELLLYGIYECSYNYERDVQQLIITVWILTTVWEVLALCLVVWIAVKHFRELQRPSTGWTVGDCFTVLIKTHVLYFAIFVAASCLHIGFLSPKISQSWSLGAETYYGTLHICAVVQKFVLGPRLILGVREYHAKLEANCDAGTDMASIIFQERAWRIRYKRNYGFWPSDEWLAELGNNIRLPEDPYEPPTQKQFWMRGFAHIRGCVDIDPLTIENNFQPETNGAPLEYLDVDGEVVVLSVCFDDEAEIPVIPWQEQVGYLTDILGRQPQWWVNIWPRNPWD